uniref:Olfactory receptor family 51 subfamily B member 17 n=1 Tax=Nannospalax galili TaxID=1026970 RepID=A0A8C6RYE9_NANGA
VAQCQCCPFLLTGFPGLEAAHPWISIPFFAIYVSVLLGNGMLLYLIKDDLNLHEPMYYFLAMMAGTDLTVTLTTMATVMGVLWVNHRAIRSGACFLQAYIIHSLSTVESGVLLAIGLGVVLRAFLSLIPLILPLFWFPYCGSHVLSHTFCLHQEVMKLACADITFNCLYPVVLVALTFFLDALIIVFSYVLILKIILGIASGEERGMALNTCVSHISCVLVFYITVIGLTLIHRFGKHAPHVVHITMSYIYFLFPPFMNPVIYSINIKQIQRSIVHLFSV